MAYVTDDFKGKIIETTINDALSLNFVFISDALLFVVPDADIKYSKERIDNNNRLF